MYALYVDGKYKFRVADPSTYRGLSDKYVFVEVPDYKVNSSNGPSLKTVKVELKNSFSEKRL